jgi:Ca2+-transporting ATPase
VQLELGDEVPADGQVLESVGLHLDESRLTGESKPAAKEPTGGPGISETETAYPPDQVFRGTVVTDGHGLVRITAVGDATEIGRTARAAAELVAEESPLTRQLEKLSKLIGVVGLGVATLTFAALIVRGAWTGSLALDAAGWYLVGVLGLSAVVGLIRVWLPIVYDGIELATGRNARPSWLTRSSGARAWLMPLTLGVLVGLAGIGLGLTAGWLPWDAEAWMSPEAGRELLTYFMVAVTIIVVAVPEGLAMSVTLSLAYSMRQMAASNNLVRRLHACETIGAATVICSDKTGTLTRNEMRIAAVDFPTCPELSHGLRPTPGKEWGRIVEAIAANSTAHLSRENGGEVRTLGNPTEGAMLLWLADLDEDYLRRRRQFAVIRQWTFTTERKFMATLGRSAVGDGMTLYVKGAPEIVLERCRYVAVPGGLADLDAHRAAVEDRLHRLEAQGMRTLALAYRILDDAAASSASEDGDRLDELARDLVWLGFVAIADPVRPEVPPAIQACRDAGVMVKVVTGDNIQTSIEVARQIGLWEEGDKPEEVWLGSEFAKLSDEEARQVALRLKVLARARPADKMRLVRLLQEQNHVVAVTGDGVNDSPALNYADVGLAMGKTGTAVAKEASDIILLDDSFRSIVNAILWGRSLYQNIQRFLLFQLTINFSALGLAMLGPFLGVKLPLTVMQMLWINLIMDTFAALALATEPPSWDVMRNKPRDPQAFILTRPMLLHILATGLTFLAVMIGLMLYFQRIGWLADVHEPTHGGTILFCVFVLLQFWNLFNARTLGGTTSAFAGIHRNPAFIAIVALILCGQVLLVTFLGSVFRTVPLPWTEWLVLLLATSPVLWIGEGLRWLHRRRLKLA